MRFIINSAKVSVALGLMLGGLVGCSGPNVDHSDDDQYRSKQHQRDAKLGRLWGENALTFGGDQEAAEETTGIGVNAYLWRASLDTVSFMPLRSIDPHGGVILSEWYTPPGAPSERLKVDIYILSRQLRADGLRVALHKQRLTKSGGWEDVHVDPKSITDFEDAILTKAREFKQIEGKAG